MHLAIVLSSHVLIKNHTILFFTLFDGSTWIRGNGMGWTSWSSIQINKTECQSSHDSWKLSSIYEQTKVTLSKFQVALKHMAKLWRIKWVKITFNNHMGWLQKYKNMEFLSNIKSSRLEEIFLNGLKPMNHFTSNFYFVNQI